MPDFGEYLSEAPLVLVEESVGGRKKHYLEGVFQMADTKNRNNRVYSSDFWTQVMDESKNELMKDLKERRLLGQLDHPDEGKSASLKDSAIVTVGLRRDGKKILGKAEILEELPAGRITLALYKANVGLGISSRGRGDAETRDKVEFVKPEGFRFYGWDVVVRPSTPGAYPKVTNESLSEAISCLQTDEERLFFESVVNHSREFKDRSVINEGVTMDPELKKLLEDVIKLKPEFAVLQVKYETLEKENAGLKSENARLTRDLRTTKSDLEEHEKALEKVLDKAESMKVSGTQVSENPETTKRLKAAESIIEEFIANTEESNKKLEAAESIIANLQGLLEDQSDDQLEAAKDALFKDHPQLKKFETAFDKCETVEDIDDLSADLLSQIPEHLRTPNAKPISEDDTGVKVTNPRTNAGRFTRSLLSNLKTTTR